ncbi:MAG: PKD domain-containing protein, partial [Thermoplasmata archaeon]|nr:PKD domain-containing protein [Thermoplasmata archaeon]
SRTSVDLEQELWFNTTTSLGSGNLAYEWSGLPDGCAGNSSSVHCLPLAAGPSEVSVNVTDSNGERVSSGALNFVVYTDPTVTPPTLSPIAVSNSGMVDAGQSVTLRSTATGGSFEYESFDWTGLPGDCTGSGAVVTCSGTDLPAGTFDISVSVTDSNDFTSVPSSSTTLVVVPALSVSIESPQIWSADLGKAVTFDANVTGGILPLTYQWTGLPAGCSGPPNSLSVHCTLGVAGTSTVNFAVSDQNNFSVTSGPQSFVVFADPKVNVTISRASVDLGVPTTLTATVTAGSGGASFTWANLPTGCSGDSATILCIPTQIGTYSLIFVSVRDSNGWIANSTSLSLAVAPALEVQIGAFPLAPAAGQLLTVTSNLSGGIGPYAYHWLFGDGGGSFGATTNHTYHTAGTYTVSLWVNDSGGGSAVRTVSLIVGASPLVAPASSTVPGWLYPLAIGGAILALAVVLGVVIALRRRNRSPTPAGEPSSTTSGEEAADRAP